MARARVASRNNLPGYAIEHQRPFSVNFGRRGPMAEEMGAIIKKTKEKDQHIETLIKSRAGGLPDLWAKDGMAGESIVNLRIGSMERIKQISHKGSRSRQIVLESA